MKTQIKHVILKYLKGRSRVNDTKISFNGVTKDQAIEKLKSWIKENNIKREKIIDICIYNAIEEEIDLCGEKVKIISLLFSGANPQHLDLNEIDYLF